MRPVLQVVRLRVDVLGVPQIDDLSFTTTGERVLVLAGPRALFAAAAGLARPRHGEIAVGGAPAHTVAGSPAVAAAPLDPPLPPAWTALGYVVWSGRLAGLTRADAEDAARDALAKVKIEATSGGQLRHAPLASRRAVSLAAALACRPSIVLLEDPLHGLTEDASRTLARTIVRATEGLRTAIFAPRASLASPLSIDADEAVLLDGSRVVGQGAPGEVAARERSYAIRLHGRGASFAQLAEARGARVSGNGTSWTVDLGASSLQALDLLDVAAASDTVILDLRPLGHAFT